MAQGDLKFQLMGPWPVNGGQWVIPTGAVLETNLAEGDPHFRWHNQPLTEPLPINVMALDQPSADVLSSWYPDQLYRLFALAPAVIRKV